VTANRRNELLTGEIPGVVADAHSTDANLGERLILNYPPSVRHAIKPPINESQVQSRFTW
jgi:hypothetical protein